MPMAPLQLSSNNAPILALVGAEILSLMAFAGGDLRGPREGHCPLRELGYRWPWHAYSQFTPPAAAEHSLK
jgi:hypothetical protein